MLVIHRKIISQWVAKLRRYYRMRVFKPYIKQKEIEGVKFRFLIGDLWGQWWYDTKCTDPVWVEMGWIRDNLIKPGDIIVDCGANHGATTIVLSHWTGEMGRVIAFEANPKNASIAAKNLEMNKIKNVEFHAKAVGNHTGKVWITAETNAKVSTSFRRGEVEVPVVRLDDLFADRAPDLLKIDVEGYEVEVIRGASNLMKKRPKLAIEIHCAVLSRYGTSVNELLQLLNLDEYHCWVQLKDGEEVIPYEVKEIDISSYGRVHLFAVPKTI